MIKRLVLMAMVLSLLTFTAQTAQAEPYFFGTTKLILNTGTEEGVGVGASFDVGLPLGQQIILRGTYEGQKGDDGTTYDNGYTGITIMSGILIENLRTGLYLTTEGGVSKVAGLPIEFGTLSSMGFYSAVGQKTKLWLGGGYSTVADNGKIWSISLGLSIQAPIE